MVFYYFLYNLGNKFNAIIIVIIQKNKLIEYIYAFFQFVIGISMIN
jgi:hypothetical protein